MGRFPLPGPDETPGPRITRGPVFLCVNLSGSYGEPPQFACSDGLDRHPRAGCAMVEEESDGGDLAPHSAGFRLALAPGHGSGAWRGMGLGAGALRGPEPPGGFEPAHSSIRPGRAGALLPNVAQDHTP